MKKNYETTDKWLNIKAASYFRNFISTYDDFITDEAVFRILKKNFDGLLPSKPQNFFKMWNRPRSREKARTLILYHLDNILSRVSAEDYADAEFSKRWRQLSGGYGLSEQAMDAFLVILLLDYQYLVNDAVEGDKGRARVRFISRCLGVEEDFLMLEFMPFDPLIASQCVEDDTYAMGPKAHAAFDNLMRKMMLAARRHVYFPKGMEAADHWAPSLPRRVKKRRSTYLLDDVRVKGRYSLPQILHALRRFRDCTDEPEDQPRMNLLLSGPPGTGKTEFVKYVAEELGFNLVVKRGSDVVGSLVGETEGNLKKIFAGANNPTTILFMDEVDGILQSRSMASQNWEVRQVTELLQQMEEFSGVFIAATNFDKNLDPAALRRFTFKIVFECLDDVGKEHFFESFFHTPLTPEEKTRLARIENLTPGDFRTVRQSQFYLGEDFSNNDRLAALEEESLAKVDTCFGPRSTRIGFSHVAC